MKKELVDQTMRAERLSKGMKELGFASVDEAKVEIERLRTEYHKMTHHKE